MSDKKNILIVPSFLADTYSNIEDIYVRMSKDLRGEFRFIWLVRDPLSSKERYKNEENRGKILKTRYVENLENIGIKVIEREISRFNFFKNFSIFKKIFKNYSIDAVYTHFDFEKYYACFFGKLFRKKVFFNEHMYYGSNKPILLKTLRTSFVNNFTDVVIAVSGFVGMSFKPSKTKILYNAIEIPDEDKRDKKELKKLLNVPEDSKVVLMVAAFRPIKRHDVALEIAKKIIEKEENVTFVFTGGGETLEGYLKAKKEIQEKERIIFTGHVNNIEDYYHIADVSILTSEFEPFGYAVIESMARKVPVIAFLGTGGPAEIISDKIDGYLVPKNDINFFSERLALLLREDTLRDLMGQRARESVIKRFTYETWLKNISNIFHEELDN
ncbi:glycosyltransferase involved in cell wall biosynthesis [Acetoanaerobium pronyense]|uniref:Glycosyltransferase involved in cell wall biosynthesis n=1 Tax=Acetoanaerobium pronyense TaxID=1482736 RepID=A0ABS4KHE0_9FIRM|nr:glycosyltransferase family 4 protein [Acetoanaerobium pronyense]MBP2027207.1 glycosyltransferase involved in cell wall biosynthesis [Acetoanaerobium pronyense]